jgi:hypothetical protein
MNRHAAIASRGNLLCGRHALEEFHLRRAYVAVDRRRAGISQEDVERTAARTLFGAPRDLDQWSSR